MTVQMSTPRADHLTPAAVPFWAGIRTVASLDLRQRWRAARTRWVLLTWIVAVYGFVGLTWLATHQMTIQSQASVFYGVTMFVVLTLALLVAPSLSASAISGDRADGVLVSLQVTLLSPAQIVLGKFLAAWAAALGFLAIAAPVLLWALLAGGVSLGTLLVALLSLILITGTVCALGLAISALTARVVSSTTLTYVVLGFLVIGIPLLFGLTLPLTQSTESYRVRSLRAGTSEPLGIIRGRADCPARGHRAHRGVLDRHRDPYRGSPQQRRQRPAARRPGVAVRGHDVRPARRGCAGDRDSAPSHALPQAPARDAHRVDRLGGCAWPVPRASPEPGLLSGAGRRIRPRRRCPRRRPAGCGS